MALKILCSVHLVRHPLGGHSWHHLQYLVGFERLGHEVVFFEDFGWPNSCYDAARDEMTSDPSFGVAYVDAMLKRIGFRGRWCYLAEDGKSHGISRQELSDYCRDCDVYFNLSNMNWIDELQECPRRVLVDTDPVFTQIGGHGMGGPFERYHTLFTYGENVHRSGCEMPTGGANWLPTRQPILLDAWPMTKADPKAPLTTVVNWTAYGERRYEGKVYGQKDREFEPYFTLANDSGEAMEIAVSAPGSIQKRFSDGGWQLADPLKLSRDPWTYQSFLQRSRGEFCVAKHGYVATRCGWFSDRSAAYLASGRPVVLQDTGFSDIFPCGSGLLPYQNREQALAALRHLRDNYDNHCNAARKIAEEYFDSHKVLPAMLERSV